MSENYFNKQVGWNSTVTKILNCKCAGYYDEQGEGGVCRKWDIDKPEFWCYAYQTCDIQQSDLGITTETTTKALVSGLKKFTGCCADDHLFATECKKWAREGKCHSGGANGDGTE